MKSTKFLFLLFIPFIFLSCFEDDDDNGAYASEINDFIWKGMNAAYLYKSDIIDLSNDRFNDSEEYASYLNGYEHPEQLFESLIYERESIDKFSVIVDNYIELEQYLSGSSISNGLNYGLSFIPNSNNEIFGFVRYVNEGSSADIANIQRGDIYEANYCHEFYSTGKINPLETFNKLQDLSLPPFSVFFKNNYHFLLSASPERYLKKQGDLLISQPIKGTAKRSNDSIEDLKLKNDLYFNSKERSENVMIVDLVRNDLSKIAQKGSVIVDELYKPYSFEQVHHLISTVKAKIKPGISSIDAIRASFPMGSMTGAPKISAMKIIEDIEVSKRGLYSGAVGYFTPNDDFDFNVVIRSILFNSNNSYISFSVGSAITSNSVAENEYDECLIKAAAMRKVLEN